METILGRRIKARLEILGGKRKGFTQSWIAEQLEITNEAVSKWVRGGGDPTLSNLRELAIILKCSIGYLAGDENDADTAAIAELARSMTAEERRYYRKSGVSLAQPEDQGGPILKSRKPRKRA